MTAILSSDSLVIVSCKICSKPVLHSSLLSHLGKWFSLLKSETKPRRTENCRRFNPNAGLFLAEDTAAAALVAAGDKDKKGKRKRETTGDGQIKAKKEKKDKKSLDADIAASAVAVGGGGTGSTEFGPDGLPIELPVKEKPSKLARTDSVTAKEKAAKAKVPIDLDKHCAVITEPGGLPCARSITCKIHSVSAKRAVVGRTYLYDVLLADYQNKSRANQIPGLNIPGLAESGHHPTRKQTILVPTSLQLGPMHIPTEAEASVLFEIIRNHQPQPLVRPSNITLSGLLSSIGTRNVGCMLREIREKRMGGNNGGGVYLQPKQQ
ncbi:UNVERIFIED_CONTAM: hypothetical protein HDU68_006487 [Siphonaria sp. JEL0065]|nr:hypothetical protein HDU68_006487 [Siphonaria sp. JEL0065]